jgi:hypothetical protein
MVNFPIRKETGQGKDSRDVMNKPDFFGVAADLLVPAQDAGLPNPGRTI